MTSQSKSSVEAIIAGLQGKRVFFEALRGNNGDDLIVMGIEELLRRYNVNLVTDIGAADHLLLKGGGALLDSYPDLLREIEKLLHETSATPTTWLPTSCGLKTWTLASLIGRRTASLEIFAREKYSFDAMSAMRFDGPVTINLDHDTAFHLATSDFLNSLRHRKKRHILIVERMDKEALSPQIAPLSATATLVNRWPAVRAIVPGSLKTVVRRALELPKVKHHASNTAFAHTALARIHTDLPDMACLPVFALDISSSRYCSFHQFANLISTSAVVYTTRLHVGILSALLDIPTYFVEGVYHKIRGVYEHSLQNRPHVAMCNTNGEVIVFGAVP